jgi:hypothetical protein
MAYGYLEPAIKPVLAVGGGKESFASLLGVPFWALALVAVAAMAAFVCWLERMRSWTDEVGKDVDGLQSGPSRPDKASGTKTAHA